jgi:hypothetical protein
MRFLLFLALALLFACQAPDPGAEQLARQRAASHQPGNPYRNELRIAYFDSLRAEAISEAERYEYRFLASVERLRAGHSQAAADSLAQLRADLLASPYWRPSDQRRLSRLLLETEALAYLRMGEQENCLADHGAAHCILPIATGGMHHQPIGSRKAAERYAQLLATDSSSLGYRWLYTLARQNLGEYDLADPALLPPETYQDSGGAPIFRDIAPNLGLDVVGLSGGSVMEDFDGDGRLDIMASAWGPEEPLRLFLQKEPGQFVASRKAAGLAGITGGLNLLPTDYDNDGLVDVLLLRGGWMEAFGELPNSLLRNCGNGRFEEVSWEAGLRSALPTQTAIWRDFDRDGWLDLFIGHETSDPFRPQPCELYLNQQDGTFREIGQAAGVDQRRYVKGVSSADFDHNGYPDLFLATLLGEDVLLMNQGPQGEQGVVFVEKTQEAGLGGNISSFPTWTFDYNHDGWEDIFVSGLQIKDRNALTDVVRDHLGLPTEADKARLWHNNGDGTFTDVAPQVGLDRVMLAMGSNFGDFDNDGWLDLYLGTGEPSLHVVVPNRAFLNLGGKRFREVSFSSGLGHIQKGHGISFGDWDHDGDQDIHANLGGAFEGDAYANALFENPYDGPNHWLKVRLIGQQSNRTFSQW